jgi:hypothetical protein
VLGHPSVVLGELDAAAAAQVDQLLGAAGVFDALAGHVVRVARQRGRLALTADPGRVHRIAPTSKSTCSDCRPAATECSR